MREYSQIAVEVDDAVATIRFDRPDALNAITPTMLGELNEAVDGVLADDAVRIVVLTGSGRAFSAGVDLKALGDRELHDGKGGDVLDVPARRLTDALAGSAKVTVAAVNGHCFTGALELALACDLMLVADEARIGDTHAKFGLRPTWGMSQRLVDAVGIVRARELSYTARMITGAEAAEIGSPPATPRRPSSPSRSVRCSTNSSPRASTRRRRTSRSTERYSRSPRAWSASTPRSSPSTTTTPRRVSPLSADRLDGAEPPSGQLRSRARSRSTSNPASCL